MSTILQTTTTLGIVNDDFTLLTVYSGETNPNVTFDAIFTVTDEDLIALENVEIVINSVTYLTDANGQSSISLIRDDYVADISLDDYISQQVNFTILDQNVIQNITLIKIGSFDESYDESYTNQQ